MNIFEALSKGNGSINEVHVSSFLGYLLNPKQDHGLKSEFLKRFVNIKINEEQGNNYNYMFRPSLDYNSANLEYEVQTECDNKRFIDIVIKIADSIIAIENKIDNSAIKTMQLIDEYKGLSQEYKNKKIHFIFLVPEMTKTVKTAFENLEKIKDVNDTASVVLWEQVYGVLSEILKDELEGVINPIDNYLKEIIKSFIAYCNTKTIKNSAYFKIKDKEYDIIKYSNGQSDIFEYKDNRWQKIEVSKKSILQEFFTSKGVNYSSSLTTNQFIDKLFNFIKENSKR